MLSDGQISCENSALNQPTGQPGGQADHNSQAAPGESRRVMNLSQYAAYRGVSQPRISAMVRAGQLEGAYRVLANGRYEIDVEKADQFVEQVRDPRHDVRLSQQKNLFTGRPMVKKRPPNSTQSPGTLHGTARAPGMAANITYAEANATEKHYKAELARLEYEKRLGALVPKDEVDRQAQAVGALIRTRLQAIPNKLAPTVAGLSTPAEVAEQLKTEINQLLTDLANDVSALPFG